MSIEDITGQPYDNDRYIRYEDIPTDKNKIYDNILGDDGGVDRHQGIFHDPATVIYEDGGQAADIAGIPKKSAYMGLGLIISLGVIYFLMRR